MTVNFDLSHLGSLSPFNDLAVRQRDANACHFAAGIPFESYAASDWSRCEFIGCRIGSQLDASATWIDRDQLLAFLRYDQHAHRSTIVAADKRGKLAVCYGCRWCYSPPDIWYGRGKRRPWLRQ